MSQAETAITKTALIEPAEKSKLTESTLLENIILVIGFLAIYGFIAYYLLFTLQINPSIRPIEISHILQAEYAPKT